MTAKSVSIKEPVVNPALRVESGRTYLGNLPMVLENETEGRAIGPDRTAEVSRGEVVAGSGEGPNVPRKGSMGVVSKLRNS